MKTHPQSKVARQMIASIIVIFVLSFCLAITTFSLAYSIVEVENNLFVTGTVKINLNDGKQVITESDFLFEPGMTVKKDFFVQNESTCEIYYRLYFQNVSGGLADLLEIKICDGDIVLYEGTPSTLTKDQVQSADDTLALNDRRDLQIYFYFPEDVGNQAQNLYLTFDLVADAVQTKNNQDKVFD